MLTYSGREDVLTEWTQSAVGSFQSFSWSTKYLENEGTDRERHERIKGNR